MSKPRFNYILNDLAFSNLQAKCLYTECTEQDIVEFENQLKLKEQELQRKDNIINEYENKGYDIATERADFLLEIQDLQQELQRKDNNWNELKEFILNHYIVGHTVQNGSLDMIINKMKELEESK